MGVRKKVEERRKNVFDLYKNKKLNEIEIAIELRVSKATISNDLRVLFAEGVLERRRKRTILEPEEIEERRKRVLELYKQKPSISYIAKEMGLRYATVYNDVKVLIARKQIVIGETNESENKENESEESSEVQEMPEESRQLQNEEDENKPKSKTKKPEKLYTSMMIGKIMEFYKREEIENAIQYLEKLQNELKEYETRLENTEDVHSKKGLRKSLSINIENTKKRIEETEKLIQEKGNQLDLSAAMFMMTGHEVIYLFSGNYDEYMKFNAQYAIQWNMIQYANEHGFDKYNFYGISGNFDENDSEYGVYEFKRGFSGYVEELIGEFQMPINMKKYTLFNIINNTKRFIKRCIGR